MAENGNRRLVDEALADVSGGWVMGDFWSWFASNDTKLYLRASQSGVTKAQVQAFLDELDEPGDVQYHLPDVSSAFKARFGFDLEGLYTENDLMG